MPIVPTLISFLPINPRLVPRPYPPATSELTVYPSHNKAHSAEDILIRSAERLVLILATEDGTEKRGRERMLETGGRGEGQDRRCDHPGQRKGSIEKKIVAP